MMDIVEKLRQRPFRYAAETDREAQERRQKEREDGAKEISHLREEIRAEIEAREADETEILLLKGENTRLRGAVKSAYYEGWQDSSSREYSRQEIDKDWETSEACAAIRSEGEDSKPET